MTDSVPTPPTPSDLHKTLTVGRGIAVAISMIVGSGLLVLPGLAYAQVGGAAVFAWGAAALVVLPLLVVFGRLGARHPNAGGVVGFVQAAYGRRGSAPVAFLLLGACTFGGAAMALTGGNYVAALVGRSWVGTPAAVAYLVVVCGLNAAGSRLAGGLQAVVTAALVLLIATVAAVPFLTPGFPTAGGVAAPAHWLDVLPVVGLVFFAFTGWELVASTTEEYRDPARDLKLALGISFVVIVVLYLGIALAVQVSLAPDDPMLRQAPVAAVLRRVLGGGAATAASALGCLIVFATLMGGTWATSRIAFATAREGLLPGRLAHVDPRRGVPTEAIVLSVLLFGAVLLARSLGLVGLDEVFRLSAVCFVLGYVLSVAAYPILFRRRRDRLLALLAGTPVTMVLVGFGWLLLYPLTLVLVGTLAHLLSRRASADA